MGQFVAFLVGDIMLVHVFVQADQAFSLKPIETYIAYYLDLHMRQSLTELHLVICKWLLWLCVDATMYKRFKLKWMKVSCLKLFLQCRVLI